MCCSRREQTNRAEEPDGHRKGNTQHGPKGWCGPGVDRTARPVTNASTLEQHRTEEQIDTKRSETQRAARNGDSDTHAMEEMTIRLISLVERDRHIRARLRAEAPAIGVNMWLEVSFRARPHSSRGDWAEEAYDRALCVLDPA